MCRNIFILSKLADEKVDVDKKKIDRNSGKNKDVWVRSSILCVIAAKKKKRKTSTTITINKRDLAS